MGYVLALIAGIMCGALGMALMVAHEHRRAARFLEHRPVGSNARLNVQVPGQTWRELVKAINSTLDAIQSERIRSIGERQEFQRGMSALAHDVRTPLMGAQGHIQLALDECDQHAGGKECVRHLAAALNRLTDMRDLLDQLFSYTQANDPDRELDIESVAVHPLLAGILVGHYPEFEERGWEPVVQFENDRLVIEADKAALGRIFDNLVVNMLRHGSGSPSIRQRKNVITFTNAIDAHTAAVLDPKQMFVRLYQADDTRSSNGAGLGLSVAQSLAQTMGFSLSAWLEYADGGENAQPVLVIDLDFGQSY